MFYDTLKFLALVIHPRPVRVSLIADISRCFADGKSGSHLRSLRLNLNRSIIIILPLVKVFLFYGVVYFDQHFIARDSRQPCIMFSFPALLWTFLHVLDLKSLARVSWKRNESTVDEGIHDEHLRKRRASFWLLKKIQLIIATQPQVLDRPEYASTALEDKKVVMPIPFPRAALFTFDCRSTSCIR